MRTSWVVRANNNALEVEDFPTLIANVVTLVMGNISFSVDVIPIPEEVRSESEVLNG